MRNSGRSLAELSTSDRHIEHHLAPPPEYTNRFLPLQHNNHEYHQDNTVHHSGPYSHRFGFGSDGGIAILYRLRHIQGV